MHTHTLTRTHTFPADDALLRYALSSLSPRLRVSSPLVSPSACFAVACRQFSLSLLSPSLSDYLQSLPLAIRQANLSFRSRKGVLRLAKPESRRRAWTTATVVRAGCSGRTGRRRGRDRHAWRGAARVAATTTRRRQTRESKSLFSFPFSAVILPDVLIIARSSHGIRSQEQVQVQRQAHAYRGSERRSAGVGVRERVVGERRSQEVGA